MSSEEEPGRWTSLAQRIEVERRREMERRLGELSTAEQDHGRQRAGYTTTRKAGELDPEWVMVGVDVPAGKRLYASKELQESAFEAAMDEHWNGDGWHLTTTMQHMLVITKPTYGECLAELQRIWRNWENEGRELPAGQQHRRAL